MSIVTTWSRFIIGLTILIGWHPGVIPLSAASPEPVWQNLGPGGGGWIQSICASPHDQEELFVGCDVGGFYRSTNGGRSYRINNTGLEDYWVECIVPHPQDPNLVYLGCESGVYKSTDRGRTWQWLREGFPPKSRSHWTAPIGALVLDPRNPDTLYAGIGSPRWGKFGQGAVYRSTDAGHHWSRINQPGSLPRDAIISDLVFGGRDNRTFYLACQYGLFQSQDGGTNWHLAIDGLPHRHVRRVAVCRRNPNVVYLTLESPPGKQPWQGGVYKSTDAGQHWTACVQGLNQTVGEPGQPGPLTANYDRIAVHPENADIVYVGGSSWVNATIYKTTDGGKTWTDIVRRGKNGNTETGWITFTGPTVMSLTISPLAPETLYFGTSMIILRTTDGGQHWQQAYTRTLPDGRFGGTGLETTCLHSIIVHPKDAERLYLGYADIGLLVSEDGGKTFRRCVQGVEPRNLQNACLTVAFDPSRPEHCWGSFGSFSQNQGVVAESSDGGFTWHCVGTPETGLPNARHRTLLVDALGAGRHLLTTADGRGVYGSDDGGHTWLPRNAGLPHGNVFDLIAHPTRPGAYWCALGPSGKLPAAVFRTEDSGKLWRQVSPGLPVGDIRRMAVAHSDAHRLYLAARSAGVGGRSLPGGVYRSDDGGVTWKRILEDDFAQGLAVDPRHADVVYAGLIDHPYHDECTGRGIVMTRNGGKTWVSLNGVGLSCLNVGTIVIDPHDPHRLYLGAGGNSLFVGQVR